MMYWGPGTGGWWMLFGGVLFFLFWVGIILLAIWGWTRVAGSSAGQPSARQSPLDIVKERYARGEISKEEFEELKKDLS